MKTKIMMAAVLAALVATAGAAQPQNQRERPDFTTLDLDGDGALTREELQAHGEARFATVDANGDGAVSADELIAASNARAAERAAAMIARLDENGDGVLQQDEMQPRRGDGDRAARMFERVDADGNGTISQEEFDTARERHGDRHGQGPRDRG
jgi:Ca2+-binding EF-hand superfamily protein